MITNPPGRLTEDISGATDGHIRRYGRAYPALRSWGKDISGATDNISAGTPNGGWAYPALRKGHIRRYGNQVLRIKAFLGLP